MPGFFFAYPLRRPIRLLRPWPHGKLAAILTVAVFYATIGVLPALPDIRAASAAQSLIQVLPHLFSVHIEPILTEIFRGIERLVFQMDASLFDLVNEWDTQLVQSLGEAVSGLSIRTTGAVSGLAATLPGFFIKLLQMVVSTFFIAPDDDHLTALCLNQLNGKAKDVFLQIKEYLIGA